jgi:ribosomal-protein-alanine N-acetyltransferase
LVLRGWRPSDLDPFAALNADPEVTKFLPGPLTRDESAAMIDRIDAHFAEHGFGLWAVEVVDGPPLIGFVGLAVPRFTAPFTPCVEVGWRLARDGWGHGYATEAATEAIAFGFGPVGLDEIVSFTAVDNLASRAVMERLGMRRDPADDFDHPSLPEGHWLRRHVLYRLAR